MKKEKVLVLILNYNTWKDTISEVEILFNILKFNSNDILVIDNCSTNESAKMLLEQSNIYGFQLICSEINGGYASGNNIGLRYAKNHGYKYAWILNNDILFSDESLLCKMIQVFEKDESVAVVNPDIYSSDGYMFNREAVRPNFFDLTIGMLQYRKKGRCIRDLGKYGYVYRPQGCCMVVDVQKLSDVDYMDEYTFLYAEEIILAERLRKFGYTCACRIDTKIIHNHSKTVKETIKRNKILKIQSNSFNYYLKKYRNYGKVKRIICLFFYYIKQVVLN